MTSKVTRHNHTVEVMVEVTEVATRQVEVVDSSVLTHLGVMVAIHTVAWVAGTLSRDMYRWVRDSPM